MCQEYDWERHKNSSGSSHRRVTQVKEGVKGSKNQRGKKRANYQIELVSLTDMLKFHGKKKRGVDTHCSSYDTCAVILFA